MWKAHVIIMILSGTEILNPTLYPGIPFGSQIVAQIEKPGRTQHLVMPCICRPLHCRPSAEAVTHAVKAGNQIPISIREDVVHDIARNVKWEV